MLDLLKQSALVGVGLAFMTKKKVESLARELAEKAKLSEDEGRQFVDELKNQSAEAREAFEAKTAAAVREVLAKMHLATRKDMVALEQRVAALEAAAAAGSDAADAGDSAE